MLVRRPAPNGGGLTGVVHFRFLTAIVFLSTVLAFGCGTAGKEAAGIRATWQVLPEPLRAGPVTVAVTLTDSTQLPVPDARVVLEGTMTHPGMQPVRAEAREVVPGRYEAMLDLTMGGDWILLLTATLPDGRTVRRQHEVRGVRTP